MNNTLLNDTFVREAIMKEMVLIYINGLFYPKTKGYTIFSASHGTSSKIDHINGHKTVLNR